MIRTILVRLAPVSETGYLRRPLRGPFCLLVVAVLSHGVGCAAVHAHEFLAQEQPLPASSDAVVSPPSHASVPPEAADGPVAAVATSGDADSSAATGDEEGDPEALSEAGDSRPGEPSAAPDSPTRIESAVDDGNRGDGREVIAPDVERAHDPAVDFGQEDPAADAGQGSGADPEPGAGTDPEVDSEADPAADSAADGGVIQVLESGQEAVARTVVNLSRAMDRMLGAREIYPDELYDSIMRVRFIQRFDDAGGSRLEPRVSGRVSLPGAEERWSVIFFSDDYEDPLDRERGTDRELDEQTRGSIALRYLKPLRDNAKTSLSIGLRTGPIDTILRGRLWYELDVGKLAIRPEQTLFWYNERGLGTSTWLRFEHPLSGLKLLRSESGATWFRRDERFYYDQIFSLLQPLSKRRGLLWQIGMQAESEPNANVTNYYAQVRWRSLVHRDWLIFELRPQLIRERANDFHLERRIFVGFELLFGDPFRIR